MAALLWCSAGTAAHAVTAEVARACNAQVAKAFPPRQVGNPAAGSAKGNAKAQREFFAQCVARDGKMDGDPAPGDEKK
ncbi:hypothetical protein J6500_26910 [Bradyrhizobium sp. WSM 1704]|uniref:hypothetical protein n=1 Tax=Bradyrhizobium semiaridum TaxID=2821404 RepID=UPI001CE2E8AF|nr:hypothetical protein [Bradyrhizobium semiaridum]MCA6125499.1 hypothetical protein [Bradyrhizobium semiaridum]